MANHKEYLKEYSSIWGTPDEDKKQEKIDGYDSEVYDEMERFEDQMKENGDLYVVFENINNVLDKPCYSEIQTITPSMDVNNGALHIIAVTKDNSPENEEMLIKYVADLKDSTKSKLKFDTQIDEFILDGMKKFQMKLLITRGKGK